MASLAEMKQNQGTAVAATKNHPILGKTAYLDKRKDLLGAGIPGHMTVEREIRTATVMLMQSKDLQAATPESFYTAISIAVNSGIGLGSGKGYLVAYKGNCQYVPGWKGLVDLVSRSGRGTVWTGIVHKNDHFEYALGDSPFLTHRPGDNEDYNDITHIYSIGRVKGSEWPIIEVWSIGKVVNHLNTYNKVGSRHYALKDNNNMEMYARKVVLLQVLKYMPQSQDLENALAADTAAETNKSMTIEGNFMYINDEDLADSTEQQPAAQQAQQQPRQATAARRADTGAPIDLPGDDEPQQPAQDHPQDQAQQDAADDAFDRLASRMRKATDPDVLDADADLIRGYSAKDSEELTAIYKQRRAELENPPAATRSPTNARPAATTTATRPARAARPAMDLE